MFSQACTYHTTFRSTAFPFMSFKFISLKPQGVPLILAFTRFREQVDMDPIHTFRTPVIFIQV